MNFQKTPHIIKPSGIFTGRFFVCNTQKINMDTTSSQLVLLYDGTFEGLLSAVFDAYRQKQRPAGIVPKGGQLPLFATQHTVITSETKSQRVWKGLGERLSRQEHEKVFQVFLSELPEVDWLLFRYICQVFDTPYNTEQNYGDELVLQVKKIYHKVAKEALKMISFVRFQKTTDGTYFAGVAPRHNVLSMIAMHFKNRFADQRWVIYDMKRDYGIFYDMNELQETTIDALQANRQTGKIHDSIADKDETFYRRLWQQYYHSATIKERSNRRQLLHFMPLRYWQYLPERWND